MSIYDLSKNPYIQLQFSFKYTTNKSKPPNFSKIKPPQIKNPLNNKINIINNQFLQTLRNQNSKLRNSVSSSKILKTLNPKP